MLATSKFDPLKIRLYLGLFSSICEEMGLVLQRTAFSPNINERRDFSCALFDHKGDLLAQASHIPVHLGSAQTAVKAVLQNLHLGVGDMAILNDPFQGGTHLPDLTLISPVFATETSDTPKNPSFYVCNRAHHADIGGKTFGSLPLARNISEEGLRLKPVLLLKNNQLVGEVMEKILNASKMPRERHGDLLAQIAANKFAHGRLQEYVNRYGLKNLKKVAKQLQVYAKMMMLAEIKKIPKGHYSFEDYLEAPNEPADTAGAPQDLEKQLIRLAVKISVADEEVSVDFTGSSPQTLTSLNTVFAVTQAAVLYVFCAIAEEDFPVNAGCLEPLRIIAPAGSIVNAQEPAAVSAGNVETSQRLVDILLGALSKALPQRIPAASCGSMNNVCIGGKYPQPSTSQEFYAYYETIAGGQGGQPHGRGADAIQTHMTNTRNTPIEVLEHAYPLQIESYRLRKGSGGAGKFPGGNGVERSYRVLHPCEFSIISDRRLYPPYGLAGGHDGVTGENLLERDGTQTVLPGKCVFNAQAGDIIRIKTPGGGGFGKA